MMLWFKDLTIDFEFARLLLAGLMIQREHFLR